MSRPLEKFGRWVLSESRYPEAGDVDGGAIQDKAIELGLLGYVTVAEPCGEHCACAEYFSADEWPCECLRETPLAKECE
jgi:hypothetical protein